MKWDVVLYFILTIYNFPYFCAAFIETRGCNRTVRNSVGWIRWTGRMGKCVLQIQAPLKGSQIIEIRIRRLQVGLLRNSKCEGAYIQFIEDLVTIEGDSGRYCGHVTNNTTRLFLRRGSDLKIVMNSETKFAAENPVIFSAQYSILPLRLANERHRGLVGPSANECPLECDNRNDHRSCRLVSPGYPGVYPRGIRCRIVLESSAGRFRIGSSDDLYSLMNYTHQDGCSTENCQEMFQPESSSLEMKSSYDHETRMRTLSSINTRRNEEDMTMNQENRPQQKSNIQNKAHKTRVTLGRRTNMKEALRTHENLNKHNGIAKYIKYMDRYFDPKIQLKTFRSNRFRNEEQSKEKELSFDKWNSFNSDNDQLSIVVNENRDKKYHSNNDSNKFRKSTNPANILRRYQFKDKVATSSCQGDYLTLLENINGRILEITKFCGEGRIPQILTRGRNIIIEFFARKDGTIMHDGFHLTLHETEAARLSFENNCQFIFKSSDKSRETIKSMRNWYPPSTFCTYKFLGKSTEKVAIQMKIIRDELTTNELNDLSTKNNHTSVYCTGNEISIYNGDYENSSLMLWSFCDSSHADINNIQVPIISSGNSLMIQFYSAKGSFNGLEFTYSISYKFIKKSLNVSRRRQVTIEETKLISLRPVDFSVLNLNESEICDCDISDRIGTFKSWFLVLVVLGVISFLGAIFMIFAVLTKWVKMRASEKGLLPTPKW